MTFRYRPISALIFLTLAICVLIAVSIVFAEDEEKSDEPKEKPQSEYSITPQKRETSENEEELKSESDPVNLLESLKQVKKEQQEFVGPPLNPDGSRDLDKIFEQSKQEGSLKKVLGDSRGSSDSGMVPNAGGFRTGPDAGSSDGSGLVGPPIPSDGSSTGTPEETAGWDYMGPPLPDINMPFPDEFFEPEEKKAQIEFDDAEPSKDRKVVDIDADKITHDKSNHTIYLEGNAKVVYEDVTILSDFGEFNDDEEWGKFWGDTGVLCENDDGICKSERLEAYFAEDQKIAYFHENVEAFVYGRDYEEPLEEDAPRKDRLKRALGQDDTTIYCDEAEYKWGDKIFHGWVEDSEVVKIIQEGRYAEAKAVYHERNTELTILENNVKLWQKNGNWLFDRDVITDKEDKWANALLRPETTITCDLLESDGEEEITTLEGNVLAVQPTKRGSADKVVHNEGEKLFVADGSVKAHHDNGDWLVEYKIVDPENESEETMEDLEKPADGETDKFTMWTETEDFEAEGNIRVWQVHQEAKMDFAKYVKVMDRLRVWGNVEIHRKGTDNLLSEEGLLWLTTKVYEAMGNVQSEGMLDFEDELDKAKSEGEKAAGEK